MEHEYHFLEVATGNKALFGLMGCFDIVIVIKGNFEYHYTAHYFLDDTDFDMDFGSEILTDGPATVEMVNATKESFNEGDLAKFQELLLDAEKPLYKGCPDFTKLSAIVKLLNLKGKYGASDKFFTELLGLLKKMLPADSQAWRTIDEKFPEIAKDPRNLRLGISADGVDVNSGTRHHKPLVDDLHTLFETGVDTYDASTKENFNLRAIVLWTINDYPALGTLCGCPYSGFKGCVVCGKDTHCVRLSASSKQSYAGHRRYLPYNHPFRRQKKAFNGQQEFQLAPNLLTGEQIYNEIQKQKRKTTEEEGSSNQVNEAYWKKFNIWYRKLKYWRHNSVPHCIDFMHVEKNVCESLVRTLLNVPGKTKDGMNARLDLTKLGIKPELFARQEEDKTTLPPAGYTLTNAEKTSFVKRYPTSGYHKAIVQISLVWKEISLQELDKLQLELVVTLCLLEKFFPPSFFDIMIHLTVHLTREELVRNRNSPGGECIAEVTIAEEEETIEFFSEYHKTMKTIGIPPDKHVTNENEDGKPLSAGKSSEVSREVFQKAHLYVIQNTDEIVPYIERHKQVLKTKHPGKQIALLKNEHSTRRGNYSYDVERELEISKDSVSETVRWISYGPRATIVKYEAYNINRKIPLFKCDWVNHEVGGVKHDPNLGYRLVDLNSLGHKDDPFILASQARQVFYVKD
ncbi:retrovirus-related pol polyprotein from transposon TNT 1-94 [Tanacetum coccineum]